ncbi:hypothetical protein [Krasilnikovia sp. MM14-A1259]|uniref:hypothetical protein n=1 Tax=Krasilnikovia sp. MM14-A1259 TaxID=3373539 RepID=UPI003800FF12
MQVFGTVLRDSHRLVGALDANAHLSKPFMRTRWCMAVRELMGGDPEGSRR